MQRVVTLVLCLVLLAAGLGLVIARRPRTPLTIDRITDPAPEAPAPVAPTPAPTPGPLATPHVTKTRAASAAAPDGIGDYGIWSRLCDCESGKWDRHGNPIPGSGRWDYHEGYYEGGLHFAPSTWDGYRPPDYPDHAADATPEQQILVAKRVLVAQGPGAWPTCSRKVGLTRTAA